MSKERGLLEKISRNMKYIHYDECNKDLRDEIKELLAQPEQDQPVATKLETPQFQSFRVSFEDAKKLEALPVGTKIYTSPLYAAPPKREPLSDETIAKLWGESYSGTTQMVRNFARAIEKAHGIGGEE